VTSHAPGTATVPATSPDADAPTPATHPRHRIDDLLTAPIRLSIVAALSRADEIEFRILRDSIEISDSALSKQLAALEQASYVTVRKGYLGKRPRTWLSVTAEGRGALRRHLAALTAIVEGEDARDGDLDAGAGAGATTRTQPAASTPSASR